MREETYTIEIFESNTKLVTVQANSPAEAEAIVEKQYLNGDIVIDSDFDCPDVQFRAI